MPYIFSATISVAFALSVQCLPAQESAPLSATPNEAAKVPLPAVNEAVPPSEPIKLRAALSRATYSSGSAANLLLKVDFTSIDSLASKRPPLNIALVLDRSKSMGNEQKFMHAMGAARSVIENLSQRDIISIITFNERAVVLSPAGRVVNKAFLIHRLDDISPGGVTDISAGLLEGIAQIKSKAEEGQVRHVLLLTDGKANRGILEAEPMRKIAASAFAGGIGISTLGCSTEFNESRLKLLAKAGGGRYLYVRSAEELPTAFQEELQGMLGVVAQNVRVKIAVSKGGKIRKVYGRFLERPQPSYEIEIGNLRAGERGGLLLGLQPTGYRDGDKIDVVVSITYDNPGTVERVHRTVAGSSSFSSSLNIDPKGLNQEVVHYGEILTAMETAREAVESFDLERYVKARAAFEKSYEKTRQYALNSENQDLLNQTFLLKHFIKELDIAQGEGKLHSHKDIGEKLHKEADYQRYLLFHHKAQQQAPAKRSETSHEHSK